MVITGLSGSGKSSLAFDTLYAEGQRRYVESLSAYARQFLDQMAKPDVESIEGLSPAIAIEQRTAGRNPRSTVGTVTEIHDHLRLLYARVGQPHCWSCDRPIASQSVEQMAERVLARGEGARVDVLAPVVRGRKGEYKKELAEFAREGYVRARIDGVLHELGAEVRLAKSKKHDIELVVDRIHVRESVRARIVESLATALRLAGGLALIEGEGGRELLSASNACADCGVSFPELAPRLFSWSSPAGACERCDGLGSAAELDPEKLVPDKDRPLGEAIAPWGGRGMPRYYRQLLAGVAAALERLARHPVARAARARSRAGPTRHGRTRDPLRLRQARSPEGAQDLRRRARRARAKARRGRAAVRGSAALRAAGRVPRMRRRAPRAPRAAREARRPRHPRAVAPSDRRGARIPRAARARRARACGR